MPPGTVDYLHRLVGKAHNQLYRSRKFAYASWLEEILVAVPRRLFDDNCLRLAFCIFWGMFLVAAGLAYHQPGFAERVWSKDNADAPGRAILRGLRKSTASTA